jgi:cytochrome c oxidase assembly factor CtaG
MVPLTLVLAAAALVYVRGWIHLWRTLPQVLPPWRLAAFLSGLASIWIALASPLSVLDDEWLTVHMLQHLLLMTVAAPLILVGAPAITLMHGLPQSMIRGVLGPVLRSRPLQWIGRTLTHPALCWIAATGAVLAWHVPVLFELGMRSELWHEVEHASFLTSGLLFWWPVIQPWPSVARWTEWSVPLYLFLATLPCDALSAFLTFCDRVVYPSYTSQQALADQQWAGTLMWVWVTFVYLAPAAAITIRLLSPERSSSGVESATAARKRPTFPD